jgi:hypothetical protein
MIRLDALTLDPSLTPDDTTVPVFMGATDEGVVLVIHHADTEVFRFDSNTASLSIRAADDDKSITQLVVQDAAGVIVLSFHANRAALSLGATGTAGDITLVNDSGEESIHLDGRKGDITLSGADCAELFEVAEGVSVAPGSVLVLNDQAQVHPCQEAYDRHVAGIASGGGGVGPGVVLGGLASTTNRVPLALSGRAHCKIDAQFGAIAVGDLLTTSPTPGHAMKASDGTRAFGAVIGKALRRHDAGQGVIPILVALQ